jgi:hypothetical protein
MEEETEQRAQLNLNVHTILVLAYVQVHFLPRVVVIILHVQGCMVRTVMVHTTLAFVLVRTEQTVQVLPVVLEFPIEIVQENQDVALLPC